jgi:hypothetical protein
MPKMAKWKISLSPEMIQHPFFFTVNPHDCTRQWYIYLQTPGLIFCSFWLPWFSQGAVVTISPRGWRDSLSSLTAPSPPTLPSTRSSAVSAVATTSRIEDSRTKSSTWRPTSFPLPGGSGSWPRSVSQVLNVVRRYLSHTQNKLHVSVLNFCLTDQNVAYSSQVPLHLQLAWLVQNLAGHDQHR